MTDARDRLVERTRETLAAEKEERERAKADEQQPGRGDRTADDRDPPAEKTRDEKTTPDE